MKHKNAALRFVVAQVSNGNRTLVITSEVDTPFYGITICETSKAAKKKIVNYEHMLLERDRFKKILSNVVYAKAESKQYYSCECGSEILRIWYWPVDKNDPNSMEEWCFEIFDNYYLKCPKGVKDSIILHKAELDKLIAAVDSPIIL